MRSNESTDSSKEEAERVRRTYDMDAEDGELIALLLRNKKREMMKRPGGSNAHGRPKYWDSVWG